jgi:hypothetical protein
LEKSAESGSPGAAHISLVGAPEVVEKFTEWFDRPTVMTPESGLVGGISK